MRPVLARLTGWNGLAEAEAWGALPATGVARFGRVLAAGGAAMLAAACVFKLAPMHAAAGAVVAGCLLARAPVARMPAFWPLLLMLPWAMVSALASGHPNPIGGWGYLYVPIIIPFLLCALAALPWAPAAAAAGLALGVVAHTGVAALQFLVGFDSSAPLGISSAGPRLESAPGFLSGNVGPSMLLGGAALVLWLRRPDRGALGVLAWAGRCAAVSGLVMLKSRAVVMAVVAAALTLATRSPRHRWRIIGLAAAILVAATAVLAWHDPSRLARMARLEDGRVLYWKLAAHDIAAAPVIGHGGQRAFADGVRDRWAEVHGARGFEAVVTYNVHNTPLNFAVFHGIPAMLLHLVALALLAAAAWRAGPAGAAVAVFWVVCGMFDATFTSQRTAYAMAVTMALAMAVAMRRDQGPAGTIPRPRAIASS
ncbi:MAG: O-Antigen ligase [Planctomycetota bacterium]|jgi:hypothetical protein